MKGREFGPTSYSFFRRCGNGEIGAAKGRLVKEIGVAEIRTTPSFPVNNGVDRGVRLEGDCTPGQVVEIAKMLATRHVLENSEGRKVVIGNPERPVKEPALVVRS